jgi:hypothetical protein
MNSVGCSNHNLKHDTSQKPSESPTTATVTLKPEYNHAGVASLLPLAAVAGAETHIIYELYLL